MLRECPKLLQMVLRYSALSAADQEFARRSQCALIGRNPLVKTHYTNVYKSITRNPDVKFLNCRYAVKHRRLINPIYRNPANVERN